MKKQTFFRITKIPNVLLLVFFIMFVITAAASAKYVHYPHDYQIGSRPVSNTATKSATMPVTRTASNMAKKRF
jgi:hypothetical protein